MRAVKDQLPLGAVIVVALGLLLTAVVALASDEDLVASKALPWAHGDRDAIPPAGPAPLGRGGSLSLTSTGFDATETNSEGERLFQVGIELIADPGRTGTPLSGSCLARTEPPTVNARTPNRPAAFPGGTDDLAEAPWPGDVVVNHRDQGSPFSTVTLPTYYMGYGGERGVEIEWGTWSTGQQEWRWSAPADRQRAPVRLRFVSLWRSLSEPAIRLTCTAEAGGSRARVATGGRLGP